MLRETLKFFVTVLLVTYVVTLMLVLFSAPGFAQEGGSADPEFEGNAGAIIINGLRLQKRQDLDFGTIAPSLTEMGTVQVLRGRNNRSICGSTLICFKAGNRARFTVIGEPGRTYTIEDPGSILITNPQGSTMLVDTFVGAGSGNDTQWRGFQTLRFSGIQRFNIGATLHVNPNQDPGEYFGLFPVSVEYQ
ncbi:MAG: DUF4402 domain-containing protein [Aquisalinus sp.]|nr:DUF4402 domain-containing protein [Aquisalinus sp.]